jgi:hypothetical protein
VEWHLSMREVGVGGLAVCLSLVRSSEEWWECGRYCNEKSFLAFYGMDGWTLGASLHCIASVGVALRCAGKGRFGFVLLLYIIRFVLIFSSVLLRALGAWGEMAEAQGGGRGAGNIYQVRSWHWGPVSLRVL